VPDGDITLKDVDVLIGSLKAIHKKLSDKDSGAIVQLEKILEKIDPVVINLTAKKEKQDLEKTINKLELLIKTMQTEIESITAKYFEDAKELAEILIGQSVKEVLDIIEDEKQKAKRDIDSIDIQKKLNLNYLLLVSSIFISVAIGYLMGSI
jgi:Skp family chaperone for outer membrane proteins